jgi:ATP-dependent helicase/nuclease subunit B
VAGEAVQLLTYALLVDQTIETAYLSFDARTGVKAESEVDQEELALLLPEIKARLDSVLTAIEHNHALPAWGDDNNCRYCEMSGLCRKPMWGGDETP